MGDTSRTQPVETRWLARLPQNTAITNTAAATANTSNVYLARASTYTQGDTHKQTEKNKRRNAYIRGKPSPS